MRTLLEQRRFLRLAEHEWIITLDYPTNPLPKNGSRANWRGRHRTAATVRRRTFNLVANVAAIPPLGRIRAQLTWWVPDHRKRDADNLGDFEKPVFDGIVDAGVVRDDTPDLMDKPRGRILHLNTQTELLTTPNFTLLITQLDEVPE